MKLVLDTNLLIAAFFNKKSSSFRILERAKQGGIRILWTEPIRKEAKRILGNIERSLKHQKKSKPSFSLGDIFLPQNKIKNPPLVNTIKEDPQDNKFLACVLKGEADLIISNDRHLLELKKFKGIPVLTPLEVLNKL